MITAEDLTEGDAQHLATLVKDRFHHTTEKALVTTKVSHLITCHANDGTLNLGRRIEHAWLDGEEILHIVPGLNQYRQDAILFVAWL